jgi:hypothetical protein
MNTQRVGVQQGRPGAFDEWRRGTDAKACTLRTGLDEGHRLSRLLTCSDTYEANQCRISRYMLPYPGLLTGREVGCRRREKLCAYQGDQAQEQEPRDESYTYQRHTPYSVEGNSKGTLTRGDEKQIRRELKTPVLPHIISGQCVEGYKLPFWKEFSPSRSPTFLKSHQGTHACNSSGKPLVVFSGDRS